MSSADEHVNETVTEPVQEKKRGRPRKYATEEERKEAKRKNALASYYRRKATRQAIESGEVARQAAISDVIELMVDMSASDVLNETEAKPVRFKIVGDLKLVKIQE